MLQHHVGIVAAVGFPQAGLCLLQEKLENTTAACGLQPQARLGSSHGPFPPCQPYLGIAGAFQLEEQLGDLTQGTGCAQAVSKCAAQGSDQEVALQGLQRLWAENTPNYTQRPPQRGSVSPGRLMSPPASSPAALPWPSACRELPEGAGRL